MATMENDDDAIMSNNRLQLGGNAQRPAEDFVSYSHRPKVKRQQQKNPKKNICRLDSRLSRDLLCTEDDETSRVEDWRREREAPPREAAEEQGKERS